MRQTNRRLGKTTPPLRNHRNSLGAQKVARLLRDELSDIISNRGNVKASVYPDDHLLQSIAIANIDFSADLSIAKVYVSLLGNSVQKRQVFVWLCDNVRQIRHSLSQRLRNLKRLPEITFRLVDTQSSFYLRDMIDGFSSSSSLSSHEGISKKLLSEGDVEFEEVFTEERAVTDI
eukprot:CAMPEP_0181291144 /NCGR_PEP_ID=MMETSP1101-20121128/1806_1 /TAXON_ID=46948 /ORGANISM="Rhodomonas abbreviata, Strain Caron Lab Isolate" /LENGTH=174 /DNA_ID=CAMNT_0023395507 /DNA_START=137 /DNA_END=661 /DNA_ORIENTATION=-